MKKHNDLRNRILLTLIEDLSDEPISPTKQSKEAEFEKRILELQNWIRADERRRRTAASLAKVQELVMAIKSNLAPELFKASIEALRSSLGASNTQLAVSFRSLTDRDERDQTGMIEDLLLIQSLVETLDEDNNREA